MADDRIRVLVVDDTAIYRKIVADILAELPDVEVVGRASDGQIALQQIERLRPHIVTLDVEMPVVDGLEVLRRLQEKQIEVGVIMLSAPTAHSAAATVAALKLGALDFVLKPAGGSLTANMDELRKSLGRRVCSLGRVQRIRRMLKGTPQVRQEARATLPQNPPPSVRPPRPIATPPKAIAVGISTGGPQALQRFLPALPGDLPVPVLLVQHMPPVFTKSLADDLNKRCDLTVCEGEDRQRVMPGHAYIAPGGQQMKLTRRTGQLCLMTTDDPPENSCRPSVDVLFRSVAEHFGAGTLAVIMTGMGNDGSAGCRQISEAGGTVYAQDEASCVVFGMPRQPIAEGLAEFIGPPDHLAAEIVQLLKRKELACR